MESNKRPMFGVDLKPGPVSISLYKAVEIDPANLVFYNLREKDFDDASNVISVLVNVSHLSLKVYYGSQAITESRPFTPPDVVFSFDGSSNVRNHWISACQEMGKLLQMEMSKTSLPASYLAPGFLLVCAVHKTDEFYVLRAFFIRPDHDRCNAFANAMEIPRLKGREDEADEYDDPAFLYPGAIGSSRMMTLKVAVDWLRWISCIGCSGTGTAGNSNKKTDGDDEEAEESGF